MKYVLDVTDVQIKGKVEVDKLQHLYYAMKKMQAMYLFVQKLNGPCFILWYDDYYPTFG